MKRNNKTEALLARVIGLLAERFKNKLILKGGMLLRLMNSPRQTQNVDYSWIRTKKRSLLAEDIKLAIEALPGVRITDQFEPLTLPDRAPLTLRMSRLEIGRSKPRKFTLNQTAELLRQKLDGLTAKTIEAELDGLLPREVLPGLELTIRASVFRIVGWMQRMPEKN